MLGPKDGRTPVGLKRGGCGTAYVAAERMFALLGE